MDHFVKNFLFQLKKGKKKKKKRSRSNDFGSDEYPYSILNSDPRISEYSDTRSSPNKYLYEKGLNQPSKGVWKTVESQVKVSEKSVNFEKDIEWQPWRCLIAIRVKKG